MTTLVKAVPAPGGDNVRSRELGSNCASITGSNDEASVAILDSEALRIAAHERATQAAAQAHETERNRRAIAGLRRAFFMRRMSLGRRIVRRLLPKPLRGVWERYHLRRLSFIVESSGLFDFGWYRGQFQSAGHSDRELIEHYLLVGAEQGLNPRADFDTTEYLSRYPLLAFLGLNPFVHFVTGPGALQARAAREPMPPIDPSRSTPAAEQERREAPSDEEQETCGPFNTGWYGARPLTLSERFDKARETQSLVEKRRAKASRAVIERHLPAGQPASALPSHAPGLAIRRALEAASPRGAALEQQPTYSIVTIFDGHSEPFRRCAISVAALIKLDAELVPHNRIEWVIANEDPNVSAEDLASIIPSSVMPQVKIISDGLKCGTVQRMNECIQKVSNRWILFLGCDDLIVTGSTRVLDHYISLFPQARHISSAGIEIGDDDDVLRLMPQSIPPSELFEAGMITGHLKALRRDLFDDVGLFDPRFTGCQEFDLALRVSLREPLLLIPDYLYRYRWREGSQSVRRAKKQALTTDRVRRNFLRKFSEAAFPDDKPGRKLVPHEDLQAGLCMIRTQGQRYELLEEAVRSVTNQPVAMTPCIIVHGELEALYAVEQWARSLALPAVVLHAPDLSKKRGYPINVGLEYLESHADQYDFVCFLDDDDIIYPLYSERLTSAINLSGADIAVGLSNQRELWVAPEAGHRLLPTSALVAGNFIPIHAFIVRTSYLRQTNVRFREDLHYLEDWDFLLQLLAGGGVFETVNEVVCEYRLIGDGNRQVRTRPEEFELCRWRVLARGSFCAQKLGGGRFCRDLAAFDFESRPALAPHEIRQLMDARSLFGIQ